MCEYISIDIVQFPKQDQCVTELTQLIQFEAFDEPNLTRKRAFLAMDQKAF